LRGLGEGDAGGLGSWAFRGREAEEGFEEEGGGHEEEEGAPDFGGEGAAVVDGVFDVAGVETGEEFFDGGTGEGGGLVFERGAVEGGPLGGGAGFAEAEDAGAEGAFGGGQTGFGVGVGDGPGGGIGSEGGGAGVAGAGVAEGGGAGFKGAMEEGELDDAVAGEAGVCGAWEGAEEPDVGGIFLSATHQEGDVVWEAGEGDAGAGDGGVLEEGEIADWEGGAGLGIGEEIGVGAPPFGAGEVVG
jgi:hypothetical protein